MNSAATVIFLLVVRSSLAQGVGQQHPRIAADSSCPPGCTSACQDVDLFPHPTECTAFYSCSKHKLVLQRCPDGLHFNPAYKVCDVPADAGCNNGSPGNQCPRADECPSDKYVLLPYLSNCNRFCRCELGSATPGKCPATLHFNTITQQCDWPNNTICRRGCGKLPTTAKTVWTPKSCTEKISDVSTKCNVKCGTGLELMGSATVTCTENGWVGTGGRKRIPACNTLKEVNDKITILIQDIRTRGPMGMLFLIDESSSVTKENFKLEKDFVSAVVDGLPLSKTRSAGVITFSTEADVDIPLNQTDTCIFKKKLNAIVYGEGNTNFQFALQTAFKLIQKSAIQKNTLIFLISDGKSQTDAMNEANALKANNHTIFCIGVADFDRVELQNLASVHPKGTPLFFGLSSFNVLKSLSGLLENKFKSSRTKCP